MVTYSKNLQVKRLYQRIKTLTQKILKCYSLVLCNAAEPAESRKSAAELKPVASNLSETASVSSSGDGGGTLTPATAAAGLAVISGDGKDASARLKESRSSSGAVSSALAKLALLVFSPDSLKEAYHA